MASVDNVIASRQSTYLVLIRPFRNCGLRFASIALLVVVWEMGARSGAVTPFMLPSLSVVLERIWTDAVSGELFGQLGLTIYRALSGFCIAAALGVTIGLAMTRNRFMHWLLDPVAPH